MKFSLVFSVLASIVVLATAYPTQGAIAKHSYVEKCTDLLSSVEKREELDVGSSDLNYSYYSKRDEGKREELYAGEIDYGYCSY
ncbi:hypothetical protein BDR06DRAFT_1017801 [Suillus hirtellus]|nr:hypothetical protein BDR06DRAFT_1017801 [Suillus hirtellus]